MLTTFVNRTFKLSFLLTCIILSVYAFVNYNYMTKLNDRYNRVIRSGLDNSITIQNISKNFSLTLLELNKMMIPGSSESMEERNKKIAQLTLKNDSNFQLLSNNLLVGDQKQRLEDLTATRKVYRQQIDSFRNLVKKGIDAGTIDFFESKVEPIALSYQAKQIDFANFIREGALNDANTIESASGKVVLFNYLISFLAIFIMVAASIYFIFLLYHFFKDIRWSEIHIS